MAHIVKTLAWADGRTLTLETGKVARQADGAVELRLGDLVMLATVVARKEIKPLVDFLPLSVDYKEHYSAAGKFPGGFFKRDGRLNEYEILTSRVVDRSLRPLFPEDYHADVQVIINLFSTDKETPADAWACVAASAALMASDIPFPDPVCTVRMGRVDGQYVVNPSVSQLELSDMDIIVAGTMDSIVMVEGEMQEVPEDVLLGGLRFAHEQIRKLNTLLLEIRTAVGKTTREYAKPEENQELIARMEALIGDRLRDAVYTSRPKQERNQLFSDILKGVMEQLATEKPEWAEEVPAATAKGHYKHLQTNLVREMLLSESRRLDGRKPAEIRPINCEVGYLPRTHGSALFTRGETQSLASVTLGSKLDEQTIDYATTEGAKRFMLQYNFPPYSTGEVKMLRAPARREIGHGNLAERALKVLVPTDTDYTIRVVSEILESNGSSSMATVCSGTLALMDAGIQIKRPASGIAMGLVIEGDRYQVLSDILGDEDHLGDMDFKVTGTTEGLTACQMDIKVRGLSFEILEKALAQSRDGRMHILDRMMAAISAPRPDISPYAPRLYKTEIPLDMIGAVIGPGGKVIQEIQRSTGTTISIEETATAGVVIIAGPDQTACQAALDRVKGIVTVPDVGEVYENAKVKFLKDAGAVMEFMPGKEGWLHISEISYKRLESMEGVLEVGEEFPVMLVGIENGRFRLSRKALLPKPEGYVEREPNGRGPRPDRGGRGGPRRRDRDR